MTPPILYTADQGSPAFEAARTAVDVVCAGDSLTGWNNFGPARHLALSALIRNSSKNSAYRWACGSPMAASRARSATTGRSRWWTTWHFSPIPAISSSAWARMTWERGPTRKRRARGSSAILGRWSRLVSGSGQEAVLFNVPNANESMFPPAVAQELREKRDYHNARLKEFCGEQGIPLADICSRLQDEHFARRVASECRRCENNCARKSLRFSRPFMNGGKSIFRKNPYLRRK